MAIDQSRRGDLDRIRLALTAVSYLVFCALRATGAGFEAGDRWFAPAFFAVAGSAASLAARRGGAVERIVATVLRLFVPAVTGFLILALPLFYLKRPGEVDEWAAHLVFLPALLACSLAMLPALMRLGTPGGRRFANRLARSGAVTVVLLLPVALPAALAAIPRVGSLAWQIGACAGGFALGGVAVTSPALEAVMNRRRWALLAVTLPLLAGLAAARGLGESLAPAARPMLEAAAAASLAPLVLGFGLRTAAAGRQVPGWLDDWVLPWFILSRPAFLAVSRVAERLPIGGGLRTVIAAVAAAALAVAACELVRRLDALRFLFGLRERGRRT